MEALEIRDGVKSVWLHIPDAWTCFVFQGVRYVKVDGQWRDDQRERSSGACDAET